MRRTLLVLALLACAPSLQAQDSPPARETLTVRQAAPPEERPVTYPELLRTYRHLQPKSDSLSPGLLGTFQTGLVVDETLTRFGRDFYEVFTQQWTPPQEAVAYTLLIQEQPLPGLSTLLTLRLDGEVVYQTPLQPGESYRDAVVQEALQTIYRTLSPTE